jgi:hypothetical protein
MCRPGSSAGDGAIPGVSGCVTYPLTQVCAQDSAEPSGPALQPLGRTAKKQIASSRQRQLPRRRPGASDTPREAAPPDKPPAWEGARTRQAATPHRCLTRTGRSPTNTGGARVMTPGRERATSVWPRCRSRPGPLLMVRQRVHAVTARQQWRRGRPAMFPPGHLRGHCPRRPLSVRACRRLAPGSGAGGRRCRLCGGAVRPVRAGLKT